MKKKVKPLNITNNYSKKIFDLLLQKQGDDRLYFLSNEIGMQQGSFRRKLENPKGWSEIRMINGLLDYFNITYDELFRESNPEEKDAREKINQLTQIIEEQKELIDTFKRVMKVIRNLSEETFQKFSNKDFVELMWKSMNEKLDYTSQSQKEISN